MQNILEVALSRNQLGLNKTLNRGEKVTPRPSGSDKPIIEAACPFSPMAEAVDLKSIQCEFESHKGHIRASAKPKPDR